MHWTVDGPMVRQLRGGGNCEERHRWRQQEVGGMLLHSMFCRILSHYRVNIVALLCTLCHDVGSPLRFNQLTTSGRHESVNPINLLST